MNTLPITTLLPARDALAKACSIKERKFAEEMSIDGNIARACKMVDIQIPTGYSWYSRPHVSLYVECLLREASERAGIDALRIRHEMACIAFSNPLDYATVTRDGMLELDLSAMSRDHAASIAEVRTKTLRGGVIEQIVKLHPKQAALHDLAKICGLMPDKLELVDGRVRGNQPQDEALKAIHDLKGKVGG